MHFSKIRGVSLTELLLGLGVAGLVGAAATRILNIGVQTSKNSGEQTESNLVLYNAYDHVFRVGRTSFGCTPASGPGEKGMECEVFTVLPPTEATTKVRFLQSNSNSVCTRGQPCLVFQEDNSGAWITRTEYSGVSDITVCGDATFTSNTCTLGSNAMNAAVVANLGTNPGLANHFIRFALTTTNKEKNRTVQGAFYARNLPGPSGTWIFERAE